MLLKVTGGTHLGIRGCYGEKYFQVVKAEDLAENIRQQLLPFKPKLKDAKLEQSDLHGRTVYRLDDKDGNTLFEYYYEEIR